MYPKIQPYQSGMLDVGDRNHIYWEVCGNPGGKPAVVLHGGPGSGCSTGMRRYFDPKSYRIVLFDQRGCGRSRPHASELNADLSVNTTEYLIADMERLRRHLHIDRWLLFGVSWGCTLGLAYAERYPHRVSEIVFVGVTMTRESEIDWLYNAVSPLFPEQWERFRAGVPPSDRDSNLVDAYYRLLRDPDPAIHEKAARDWCDWENSLVSVSPDAEPEARRLQPAFQLAFARIVTHYFRSQAWLEDGVLLQEVDSLEDIRGIMVHGRLDLGAPLATAWELARAWPGSELVIVPNAGHSSTDLGMSEAMIAATDRFAQE